MPLYDYACRSCGHAYEARAGADEPGPACPECGAADPERVITGFAVNRSPAMKGAAAKRSNGERHGIVQARQDRIAAHHEKRAKET